VAGDSLAEKAKVAFAEIEVAGGAEVMVVSGPCVSIVHVKDAAVASVPTASVARTEKVCEASSSPLAVKGLVHAEYVGVSSAQTNEAPGFDEVKENVALDDPDGFVGEAVIVVSGTVVSGETSTSMK
jgi:hypothetical protein